MPATAVLNPIPQFFELDGDPLDNGLLYFGAVNQNPITAPAQVWWDSAQTVPAAQPIRTKNGFPTRNGGPAIIYAASDFSLLVLDRRGRQVFYGANSADFGNFKSIVEFIARLADTSDLANGDAMMGVKQPFSGSAARTQHDKNAETVSVSDVATGAVTPSNVANLRAGTETIHLNAGITTGQLLLTDNTASKSWSLLGKGASSIDSPYSTTLRHGGTVLNLVDTIDYPSGSRISATSLPRAPRPNRRWTCVISTTFRPTV